MLLTLMMLPLPLAAIPGANAATRKNVARTLLANRASNVATSRSAVAPNQENPALLTNTSISPTVSTRRWRSAGSLRSAPTKRARPPAAAIDSTVSAPRVASRPWTMTSAPSRASCKATARPMPDVAPVTRAFWPWRLRGWVAGTVALRNLVVDKPLGAHNSVVSVMVPDHASVDPSGANTPRCPADLVMIRAPCVYLASRGPPPSDRRSSLVPASPELGDLPMSKAVDQMVIDHPDRLHVRIDDRRTHEGEATALQIVAHGVGLGAARGDIAFGSPAVLDRATVDEAPLVRVEAAELRLHV